MLNIDWKFKAAAIGLTLMILISHGSIWYATRQYYKRKQAEAVAAAVKEVERRVNVFQTEAEAAAASSADLHGQLTAKEDEIAVLKQKFLAERKKRLEAEAARAALAANPKPSTADPLPVLPPAVDIPALRVELEDCTKLAFSLDGALQTSKAESKSLRVEVKSYKGLDEQRKEAIKKLEADFAHEQKVKGYWQKGFMATAGAALAAILLRK